MKNGSQKDVTTKMNMPYPHLLIRKKTSLFCKGDGGIGDEAGGMAVYIPPIIGPRPPNN